MARTAAKKTDDVKEQIEDLRADVAKLTKALGDMTTAAADKAKDTADAAVDAAKDAGADVAHAADDSLAQTLEYVRDKPANAVAIAAGVGFLVGMMMSGKR